MTPCVFVFEQKNLKKITMSFSRVFGEKNVTLFFLRWGKKGAGVLGQRVGERDKFKKTDESTENSRNWCKIRLPKLNNSNYTWLKILGAKRGWGRKKNRNKLGSAIFFFTTVRKFMVWILHEKKIPNVFEPCLISIWKKILLRNLGNPCPLTHRDKKWIVLVTILM